MQSTIDANDSNAIARNLLRESTARLGEVALNYVLGDSYKGQYEYFSDYLKLETDNHHLLPHYYVVLLDRDEESFMTDLSILLRDILFYDADEPACLEEIKDRLLKIAILDREHLIDDIRGLFNLYDRLKAISEDTWEKQKNCLHIIDGEVMQQLTPKDSAESGKLLVESLTTMREIVKDHPHAKDWVPRSA